MWRNPNFLLNKHDKFQEEEQYWILPTTCPPTKLKPRTVCCQEGEDDDDMTPSDMNIDYKVSSFLHLHNDFLYNSVGSTCTYHYLLLGTNVSLQCRRGLVIHTWDPGPSWRMPQTFGEDFKDSQERPFPWPPT